MHNDYEFRVFGLRRTGNHMLISAIISTFNDNEVYYFNDIQNPERVFAGQIFGSYSTRRGLHNKDTRWCGTVAPKLVDESAYQVKELMKSDKKCFIHNYEDHQLNIVQRINTQNYGKSDKVFNILILRDPYNLIASRIKFMRTNRVVRATKSTVNMWKQYAKEYLGETNILGKNKIVVNYNKFVTDKDYQKEIIDKLGLNHDNLSLEHIMGFGKGSSFTQQKPVTDKTEYHERWKQFVDDKLFISLTNDPELKRLSNKIFGSIMN